jgi:hypothetical protein
MRWSCTLMVVAACLGACGGGGELADETLRRSAEQALDTSSGRKAAPGDTSYRVPAFLDSLPGAATARDSTSGPQASPQWTMGVVERPAPGSAGPSTLREVRVGRNQDFDRVVVDFGDAPLPGYRVEYGMLPVRGCGSGEPVALEGSAALLVRLSVAQAHDDAGRVTVPRADIRADMPVLRQVTMACDFEGVVVLALGLAQAKPYHVLVERDPNRLIVDVRQ